MAEIIKLDDTIEALACANCGNETFRIENQKRPRRIRVICANPKCLSCWEEAVTDGRD